MESFIRNLFREVEQFAMRLDTNSWAVLSVVVVIAGYLLLKGNNLRGG